MPPKPPASSRRAGAPSARVGKGGSKAKTKAPAAAVSAAVTTTGLYTKLRQLGEGSFGCIWLVRHSGDGRELVLKEMALSRLSPKEVAACRLEMEVLKRFDLPSIIAFVSSYEEPGMLGILMEHAAGGDLQRLIDERIADGKKHLHEWRIKTYALQLGMAVAYIHNFMLLLHRDIKPASERTSLGHLQPPASLLHHHHPPTAHHPPPTAAPSSRVHRRLPLRQW